MFLALCSKSLQSTDLGIQKKHTTVFVFGCLSAPQRWVCRFTMHICHLKQNTRPKRTGDRSCTLTKTLRHAHRRAHWPHSCLGTYSHTHYSDEPNKEMHTIFIYTTACYTYSKHKNKPYSHMTVPPLTLT